MQTQQTREGRSCKSCAPEWGTKLRSHASANCFAVSALSLALLAVFSSANATPADNPIAVSGPTGTTTSSNETITNSAGNGTSSGPGYAVEATNGAQVTLSGDTVRETYAGAKTFGIEANGSGTSVHATNTNVVVLGADPTDNPNNLASGNAPIGVDAQNGGVVTLNGGSVSMSGTSGGTIGVRAEGGTLQATDTNISTAGEVGYAAFAWANSSAGAHLDLDGGSVSTKGQLAYGLYSQDSLSAGSPVQARLTAEGVSVTTSGQGADAAEAYTGGTLNLSAQSSLTTSGAQASGVDASGVDAMTGAPSTAVVQDTTITTTGASAPGASANAGGQVTLARTSIDVEDSGPDNFGLVAKGAGSSITASDTAITVAGAGTNGGNAPLGTDAERGATVSLTGGSVTMTGNDRTIGVRTMSGGTTTTTGTAISTEGANSHAVLAYTDDPAAGPSQITINEGTVTTAGTNSYGLYAENTGSEVDANGVAVTTQASVGRGVYAFGGGVVTVAGGSIETNGANAEGMLASGFDANNVVGQIVASDVMVTTHGSQSSGIAAGFSDGYMGSVDFTGGSITTTGDAANGVFAQLGGTVSLHNTSVSASGASASAASVASGATLNIDGSTLTSKQSAGISLTDNATVVLTGTAVVSAGASIASTLDTAGQTQNITVGAGSVLTQNNGTLLQVSRTSAGMDGIVNLTLQAGSVASGNVVDTDGLTNGTGTRVQGGETNFVMDAGSSWTGITEGLNNTSIGEGGSFTDNGGAPIAGDVESGSNAKVTFNSQAAIGGTVQSGANSVVSFNQAATIGQDVVSDGATFAFAQAATIGRNVQATAGSTVAFAGATTIAGDVSANSSVFTFSNTAPTVIGGNLTLDNGSGTHGGSVTAPVSVAGNVVVNDSSFGGNVNVQGSLSGTNGILAPGNPGGTQGSVQVSNVATADRAVVDAAVQSSQAGGGSSLGIETFGSISGFSGVYAAQVNAAGQSDEVIVHGNADLSGIALSVGQENGNGGYRINTPYTILATDDGGTVLNHFASAALDASMANTLVELAPVQYDATDVKVQFTLDPQKIAAARSGLTQNQSAVLTGAMSVAGTDAAAATLFTSNINRADALNQLSGEGYASTTTALIQDSHYVRDAADDRLRSSFGGTGANQPVTTYGANVWTKGFGSWGHADGTANAGMMTDSTGGFLIGADDLLAHNWRVGMLGGYSHSNFDVDSRSFAARSDDYHLGVYGGTQVGNLGFRAGAAYTWSNIDSNRSVAFPGFADMTNASYDAGTTQAFGELGYQLHLGRVGVEPFVNAAYVNLHTQGFSETGGDAALDLQANNVNTAFSTLGIRASSDFSIGSADFTARGTFGWQHTYGQVPPISSVAFSGGQDFSVAGVPIVRDSAVVEIGLNAVITRNATLGISYSGQLGNKTQDNGITGSFNYRF
ncbi:autotransporter domain-containing protein [Paraburkholderia sp. BCC1885]|uniref:autotransporter domain-containing protein n=1 Tax=Paraburkholderia sp. BCC1885 TaxID=2562669 RepID=UPI001642DE7D|nr:autotransporter domain-containing protein [Paraburkholderia sp. BCC1885]